MKKVFFKDIEKLYDLKKMIEEKHSYRSIARHFQIDRTTVYYYAMKWGLYIRPQGRIKEKRIKMEKPSKERIRKPDPRHPLAREIMNAGKSYADYIKAEDERKIKELLGKSK